MKTSYTPFIINFPGAIEYSMDAGDTWTSLAANTDAEISSALEEDTLLIRSTDAAITTLSKSNIDMTKAKFSGITINNAQTLENFGSLFTSEALNYVRIGDCPAVTSLANAFQNTVIQEFSIQECPVLTNATSMFEHAIIDSTSALNFASVTASTRMFLESRIAHLGPMKFASNVNFSNSFLRSRLYSAVQFIDASSIEYTGDWSYAFKSCIAPYVSTVKFHQALLGEAWSISDMKFLGINLTNTPASRLFESMTSPIPFSSVSNTNGSDTGGYITNYDAQMTAYVGQTARNNLANSVNQSIIKDWVPTLSILSNTVLPLNMTDSLKAVGYEGFLFVHYVTGKQVISRFKTPSIVRTDVTKWSEDTSFQFKTIGNTLSAKYDGSDILLNTGVTFTSADVLALGLNMDCTRLYALKAASYEIYDVASETLISTQAITLPAGFTATAIVCGDEFSNTIVLSTDGTDTKIQSFKHHTGIETEQITETGFAVDAACQGFNNANMYEAFDFSQNKMLSFFGE